MLASFKQLLKLFRFLTKKSSYYKVQIYYWTPLEETLDFLKFFFKKFQKSSPFSFFFSSSFPRVNYRSSIKTAILFNQPLINKKFFSLLFKNLYITQSIHSFDIFTSATYNIISNIYDYKKLIFFGILFNSFFKI